MPDPTIPGLGNPLLSPGQMTGPQPPDYKGLATKSLAEPGLGQLPGQYAPGYQPPTQDELRQKSVALSNNAAVNPPGIGTRTINWLDRQWNRPLDVTHGQLAGAAQHTLLGGYAAPESDPVHNSAVDNPLKGTSLDKTPVTAGEYATIAAGGLAPKTTAFALKNEPFLGIGALSNTARGAANIAKGNVATGAFQAGVKAPLLASGPIITSQVVGNGRPDGETVSPTDKWLQEQGQTWWGRALGPAATLAKSTGIYRDPGVPTFPQYLGTNVGNLATAGRMATSHPEAFERGVGNAVGDQLRHANLGSGNQFSRLTDLEKEFERHRSTMTPDQYAAYQKRFGELRVPSQTGTNTAIRQGFNEEVRQKINDLYPESDTRRPGVMKAVNEQTGEREPYPQPPTSRDLETRDITSGRADSLYRDTNRSVYENKMNDQIRGLIGQYGPPATMAGAVGGGIGSVAAANPSLGSPTPPALTPQTPQNQPSSGPPVAKPSPPPAEVEKVVPKEDLLAAGKTIGEITGGNLEKAKELAETAPAPPGFRQYWDKLPWESRILAIAGLSITAITALRGLFGGDDNDEEPSFLMRLAPYLGIAAAAYGAGGGTLGIHDPFSLPQKQHYQNLWDATKTNLGSVGLKLGPGPT